MKSRYSSFLPLFSIVVTVGLSPLHAATIDTTGLSVVMASDNYYTGNGSLTAQLVPAVPPDTVDTTAFGFGGGGGFGMTGGGLITINAGIKVTGYGGTSWAGNLADMQLDGTLDVWDNTNEARMDALNGAGAIEYGYPWNDRMWVHVGLDGGSGTFSGTVQGVHSTGNGVQMRKSGIGTQTFDNLANQPFKNLTINAGVVNLKADDVDVTCAYPISGAGNLTKSGAYVLTLTGSITNTGDLTVSEGTVKVGANLTPNVNVVIPLATSPDPQPMMDLNFAGESVVNSITLDGTALPPGTYNATSHPTFFSNTGSLKILAPTGDQDGSWSALVSGNWSEPTNWNASTVASGAEKIATIGVASPVTVTADSNRTIGSLVFDGANHTMASGIGAILTLDNGASAPSVSVASGFNARIIAMLASTAGLDKNGDGTLTIASASSITGGTIINAGKLVLENTTASGPSFVINTGTTLELAYLSGGGRNMANGTISGGGNLVKTGTSLVSFGYNGQPMNISLDATSLIDIKEGVFRNEWGAANYGANQADLNVESGAYYDIWDTAVNVDAITGAGVINKGWAGTHTFTFGVANGGDTFSGIISNITQSYGGAGGGTLNLVKTGTGTQAFTGTTPFRGSLSVNQGILSLGNGTTSTGLPDTTPVTVAAGAKLDLNFTGSDVVGSVTLGGTTYTAPGTYGASNHPDFFTGSGSLYIGTDYDIWALNNGLTGGGNDDDDGDGITNKEEYAFGLLPKNGSSVNPITAQLDKANGTFSYTRRKPSLGTNLTYSVWFSTDLAGWTKDTGAIEGTLVPSGDNETVPVTLSALPGDPLPDKLFIQVRAE